MLVGRGIIKRSFLIQDKVASKNYSTRHGFVGNIRRLNFIFLDIDNHKAKVGSHNGMVVAIKSDVVDFSRCDNVGIFDITDVVDVAIAHINDVDIGVQIGYHDIVLIIIVVYVFNSRVTKVIGAV